MTKTQEYMKKMIKKNYRGLQVMLITDTDFKGSCLEQLGDSVS